MSTKKNVTVSGIIAAVAAIGIIALAMLTGVPATQTTSSTTTTSMPSTTTSSVVSSTSSKVPSSAQQGVFSILLTDPPNVPAGVAKVYVIYVNLAVHVSEAGNQSGWTEVKQQGTIELMSTVNVSQTISSVKIASGDYNLIRFNLTSAIVTYNGKNQTAFVPSGFLIVPIVDGIEVNASKPSAAIIDITPTVVNIGSNSNPEFIIRPVARAYPVPSSQVTEEIEHDGSRKSLIGVGWWKDIRQKYTANLAIGSASLSATSLLAMVNNTGTDATILRLVIVTPLAKALTGQNSIADDQKFRMPGELFQSAIFIVLQNGTLIPIQNFVRPLGVTKQALADNLDSRSGLALAPDAVATLSYHGPITLGFPRIAATVPSGSIVAGRQYLITALGDQAIASIVVTAS